MIRLRPLVLPLALLIFLLTVAGCGNKGDLVLPDRNDETAMKPAE